MDITDTSILAGVTPESVPAWRFRRVGACPLPVFVHRDDEYAVFYAPRVVCVVPTGLAVPVEHQLEHATAAPAVDAAAGRCGSAVERASASLVETARGAVDEAAQARAGGFQPECLTLFVNDLCNLMCGYCHALPGGGSVRAISLEAVRAAGEEVAAACARRGLVFTCVVHGGGEPTQDPSRVDAVLGVLEAVARNHGVRLWTYIATNGVMSEERARWVAARFDLVGLSCDGPPDVQERQRPARDGLPTSPRVERTARILREAGRPFHARATITQGTIERQPEIAAYLVDRLAPGEVRLEPVYDGAAAAGLGPAAAPGFVEGFLKARRAAAAMGVRVTTSMFRPDVMHGRHCNVLRGVVNLVPGDRATGCFLESREAGLVRRGVLVGSAGSATNVFCLDRSRIEALAARCRALPSGCEECLSCYQCDYGCPDVCAVSLTGGSADGDVIRAGFRCRAHRLLMEAMVLEAADEAWRSVVPGQRREATVTQTGFRVTVFRDGLDEESLS